MIFQPVLYYCMSRILNSKFLTKEKSAFISKTQFIHGDVLSLVTLK